MKKQIVTVIDLAKELVETVGKEKAIESLQEKIEERRTQLVGIGMIDFPITCKMSGLQSAIEYVNETYLTQHVAIPYQIRKSKDTIQEIHRLYAEWLQPKYGKEFRKISEDQMNIALKFLACFKLADYATLFHFCENSYKLMDDNFQTATVLHNPFTDKFKNFIIDNHNPELELTAGMITFIDAVIEKAIEAIEDSEIKGFDFLETINYN